MAASSDGGALPRWAATVSRVGEIRGRQQKIGCLLVAYIARSQLVTGGMQHSADDRAQFLWCAQFLHQLRAPSQRSAFELRRCQRESAQ